MILGVLRTVETEARPQRSQPTLADLPSLIQEAEGAATKVRLHNQINLAGAPDAIGRGAYRMVQENLTNARNTPEHRGHVTLRGRPGGQLVLEVRNPLRVGSETTATHPAPVWGLPGLTERAELIGGRVERLRSGRGARAWLPWPA